MINLSETVLTNCIIHHVGNKVKEEALVLSSKEILLTEEVETQLCHYFLKPFKVVNDTYQFYHDSILKLNEIYTHADNLFEDENFVENSAGIAQHLFKQTRNFSIKSGDLFVAKFEEITFEGTICKAIGIFKSENKDEFFKVERLGKNYNLIIDSGINKNKIDKACLILNDDYHKGFKVFVYENNNGDTDFWKTDFLSIKQREDSFYQTKNFLSICKDFVTEKLPEVYDVTKTEQIDLLNKSVDYFKKKKDFLVTDFVKDVFEEPDVIKSFKKFKNEYQLNENIEMDDSFIISNQAVKKQARVFKSVLKLDKNFHIYIHGDKDLIEQGVDKDGRKYYKLYFEKEL